MFFSLFWAKSIIKNGKDKMESNEALLAAAAGTGKIASPAPSSTTMATSIAEEGRNPSPTNPLASPIPTTLAPLVLHGHEDADVDEDDVRYNYSPDDDDHGEEDDYDDDSSEDGENSLPDQEPQGRSGRGSGGGGGRRRCHVRRK